MSDKTDKREKLANLFNKPKSSEKKEFDVRTEFSNEPILNGNKKLHEKEEFSKKIGFPEIPGNQLSIGVQFFQQELYDQAEFYLENAVRENPDDIETLENIAYVYMTTKKYVKSKAYYTHLSELAPQDHGVWNNLALVCTGMDKFDESIKYSKKAIELNSNYTPSWTNLGEAYLLKKEYEAAEKYLKMSLKKSKGMHNPPALKLLGKVYEETDRFKKALKTYEKWRSINVADMEPTLYIVMLKKKMKKQ